MSSVHITKEELTQRAGKILSELIGIEGNIKPKDRMCIPAQEMPSQNPIDRRINMEEVALGYSDEQARVEAMRCLQCKNAPCIKGCPVKLDIPGFITAIADLDYQKAADIMKKDSLLPAICGRVCPQESQCQLHCTVGKAKKDISESVAIGRLERFAADWERSSGDVRVPDIKAETGKKVAIIGSGPASLAAAADIRREGHSVTIYEALHKSGGVMVYGIPEFRLPKSIVESEINILRTMGVKIENNFVVGRTRSIDALMKKDGYDAVFIGAGAGLPRFMNIEGENLVGVYSANEYLTRSNLMKAYERKNFDTPISMSKKVAVLGGGNVAMDAVRTALRLGAEEAHLVYRRTEIEMPARLEEIEHAKEEGVVFHLLENAKSIIGDENGRVKALECLRYDLGEPDDSGRRRPVQISGSEFILDVDTVIIAIGNDSNPLIKQTTEGIATNKWGNITVDENGKTSLDGVYAGGDIVLGAATVILAMGEGRKAAGSINFELSKKN